MDCSTFIGGGGKKVEVKLKPDCKVLALQGKSSIGKTTTINKLIDYLLNKKGGKRLFEKMHGEKDRCFVIAYNGKKLGITTRGDNVKCLSDDFAEFYDCDICVCAVHAGLTRNYIKSLVSKPDENMICIARNYVSNSEDKATAKLQEAINIASQSQAENILDIINKMFF